jgi:hypothetical protein
MSRTEGERMFVPPQSITVYVEGGFMVHLSEVTRVYFSQIDGILVSSSGALIGCFAPKCSWWIKQQPMEASD